jgi:hypothetical protein
VRICRVKSVTRTNQYPGAVGRVELVARAGKVVDARGGEIDGPMGRQLSTVDGDARPVAMRDRRQLAQRRTLAGDVRGARDGEQGSRLSRELTLKIKDGGPDSALRDDALPSTAAPRQQVGVVLDVKVHDPARHGTRKEVQRVGGVAGEDDDVVRTRVQRRGDAVAGALVGRVLRRDR